MMQGSLSESNKIKHARFLKMPPDFIRFWQMKCYKEINDKNNH